MAENADDPRSPFARAMSGVRRLAQDRVTPYRPRVRPIPRQSRRDAQAVIAEMMTFTSQDIDVATGEELLFRRPGIDKETMRRMKRGHFALEAELDLHGLTVEQARTAFAAFLSEAMRRGLRCVRIIHGKGLGSEARLPVLKGFVNRWLRQANAVLAFCSARPEQGGTGAVTVLLRRSP
ncbi:Smr/MutS family protein [Acidiferrobacter sp.]|uniref:Smr/MutS family protein n=1 Tax=Acidiferrobacter sp. TaxID=1872107 RepID=UPI0026375448|nr:Smr/MutS family protein [Acidiferrobacter sp.]